MNKKIKVLDLFSGAGGLSLGFKWAGYNVVCAVDNMKESCKTFKNGHSGSLVINDDIRDVDPKRVKNEVGDIDIILGGPPCQGLSLAGKRITDDPRNKLFLEFIRFVKYFQPEVFLMENVPGLLSMDNGRILNAILNAFKDIGYNSFYNHRPQILLAANYGVPQLRKRLFFVGTKQKIDFLFPPDATHMEIGENMLVMDGMGLEPYITVQDAISDLPINNSGEGTEVMDYDKKPSNEYQAFMRKDSLKVYNHVASNHTEKLIRLIKKAKPGFQVDPKYSDSKKWHPDKPSFTVKALGAGGGSTNRRAFHYNENRGSTVRENARIQSFPDSYRFYGSRTVQMTQVGNAVPPLLAEKIAQSIKEYFIKLEGHNEN